MQWWGFFFPWKLSCVDTLLCSFFPSPKLAGSNFAFVFTHIIHPVTVRHCSKFLFSDPYKLFQVKVSLWFIWDLPCASMSVNISLVWMSIRILLLIFIWYFYISEVIYCILNNLILHVCSISTTRLMSTLREVALCLLWITFCLRLQSTK